MDSNIRLLLSVFLICETGNGIHTSETSDIAVESEKKSPSILFFVPRIKTCYSMRFLKTQTYFLLYNRLIKDKI
jgi:hypothetical protein